MQFADQISKYLDTLPDLAESVGQLTTDPLHKAFKARKTGHSAGGAKMIPPIMQQMFHQKYAGQSGKAERRVAYLHIPFCRMRCSYCGFFKNSSDEAQQDQYVSALLKEIEQAAHWPYYQSKALQAVFVGGGTPGVLSAQQIARLLAKVRQSLPLSADCEITFETSLSDMDEEKLKVCLDSGVNRFSFGIQTFNTSIRRRLGRQDDESTLRTKLNRFVKTNASIVIDLLYGLPGQTTQTWEHDLEVLLGSGIHGADLYQLQIFPGTPLDKDIAMGKIVCPDMAEQADLFAQGVQAIGEAGWRRISLCHWASCEREHSRYNSLSKQGAATLCFGAGSGGDLDNLRIMQEPDIQTYIERVNKGEKPLAFMLERDEWHELWSQIIGQMDAGRLSVQQLEEKIKLPLTKGLRPLIDLWQQRGLLVYDGKSVELTLAGQYWQVNLTHILLHAFQYALYGQAATNGKSIPSMGKMLR